HRRRGALHPLSHARPGPRTPDYEEIGAGRRRDRAQARGDARGRATPSPAQRRRRRDERLKEGTTPKMQLKRSSFVAALAVMLVAGVTLGAVAGGRADSEAPPVVTPTAPVLPVQMPLNTGSFAVVDEFIKPAVITINSFIKVCLL